MGFEFFIITNSLIINIKINYVQKNQNYELYCIQNGSKIFEFQLYQNNLGVYAIIIKIEKIK